MVTLLLSLAFNREEKSLHHIAMVAKFFDDNNLKRHLHCKKWIRTASNFIDLFSFHLICQMLVKFSGSNRKGGYVSLEKEKQNFCVVLCTYSIRWAREIRKFHVAVIQSNFANLNLLFFSVRCYTVAKTPYCCHPEILLPW